jgi:hypothetical protein
LDWHPSVLKQPSVQIPLDASHASQLHRPTLAPVLVLVIVLVLVLVPVSVVSAQLQSKSRPAVLAVTMS